MHPSQTLNLTHWGAGNTPYAIAIALPGSCLSFPGIGNSLMLDLATTTTLTVGVTGSGLATLTCPQLEGRGQFTLFVPQNAPVPLLFRLQSLGMSNNGMAAFSRALEVTLL